MIVYLRRFEGDCEGVKFRERGVYVQKIGCAVYIVLGEFTDLVQPHAVPCYIVDGMYSSLPQNG